MFEYEDLTEEQKISLENKEPDALIAAALLIVHAARSGMLDTQEALKQLNNVLIAAL